MVRRYHESSPNSAVLNLLLGAAAILCLWNLWAAPSATEEAAMKQQLAPQYVSLSDGTLVPIQTINGHNAILISPHLRQLTPLQMPPILLLTNAYDASISDEVAAATQASVEMQPMVHDVNDDGSIAQKPPPVTPSTVTSKINPPSSRKLSTSDSFAHGIKVNDRVVPSRKLSRAQKTSSSRIPSRRQGGVGKRTRTVTVYLLAISGSIIAGAMMAKKALDKVQRWEQLSQEDSLAYDMAYTSTTSEMDYGSFVSISPSWTGDLDKFDV